MGQVNLDNVHDVITFHKPDDDGLANIQIMRDHAEAFIIAILKYTPLSADQSSAVRHVRSALMEANAAIVLKGLV